MAVSRRDDVIAYLDAMRASGLTVDALEIGPVAIRRLANALPASNTQMVLIVNTGFEASYLTMLSGRRLLMDQAIEFSESRVLGALAIAATVGRLLPTPGKLMTLVYAAGVGLVYLTLLVLSRELGRADLQMIGNVLGRRKG